MFHIFLFSKRCRKFSSKSLAQKGFIGVSGIKRLCHRLIVENYEVSDYSKKKIDKPSVDENFLLCFLLGRPGFFVFN